MANKESSALLKMLAGLDLKGSLELMQSGMKEIEKLIQGKNLKLGVELDLGPAIDMVGKAIDNMKAEQGKINPINNQEVIAAQKALFKTEDTMKVIKDLMNQANPDFLREFKNFEILNIKRDADNVKSAIVQVKDELGNIQKIKFTPAGKDPFIQVIASDLDKKLKSYETAVNKYQAEINKISKREVLEAATETELVRKKELIGLIQKSRGEIKSEVRELEKIGVIDKERRVSSEIRVSNISKELIASRDLAVAKAKEVLVSKDHEADLQRWKQLDREIVELEKEKNRITGTGRRLIEEKIDVYDQEKTRLYEILKLQDEQGKKIIEHQKKSKIKTEKVNRYNEYALADKSLKELNQSYQKMTENKRRIYDIEQKTQGTRSASQQAEIDLLNRSNAAIQESIAVKQKAMFLEELRSEEAKAYYVHGMKERKKKMTDYNKEIEALRRIRELEKQEYANENYGNVVGETNGKDNNKLFEVGNRKALDNYVAGLVGAHAQIKQISNVTSKHGNIVKALTVVEDRYAKQKKEILLYYDKEVNALRRVDKGLSENLNRNLNFMSQVGVAVKKIATYGVAARGLYAVVAGFKESVSFLQEIDKEFTQIAISQNMTLENSRKQIHSYEEFAQRLGKTVKEISTINTELVRQGLTLEESKKRMETILKLSNVGAISAAESMKIVTASVNAMQVGHERAADILLRAGQITAASVEELGEAFTKTASSAQATGMEMEEVASIVSTLIEVTQEGPRELGTSLKTILARFNRVNSETGEFNTELNDVQKAIESVGVAFTGADGQIRDVYAILEDLSGVWETLNKNEKAYLATQAAGIRQQNRFFAIMNNFNRVQAINNDLLSSSGALNKAQVTYMTSLEAAQNKYKTSMESLATLIQTEWIKHFYDIAAAIATVTEKIGLLGIMAAGGAMYTFIGSLQEGTLRAQLLGKAYTGIAKAYKTNLKALVAVNFLKKEGIVLDRATIILKKEELAQEGAAIIADTLRGASLNAKIAAYIKLIPLQVKSISLTMGALAPYLAVAGALAAVAGIIIAVAKNMKAEREERERLNQSYLETKNRLVDFRQNQQLNTLEAQEAADALIELNQKVKEYGGLTALTSEELEKYYELNAKLKEIYPGLESHTDRYGNEIVKVGDKFNAATESAKEYDKIVEKIRNDGYYEKILSAAGEGNEDTINSYKELQERLTKLKKEDGKTINYSKDTYGRVAGSKTIDNSAEIAKAEAALADLRSNFKSTASSLVDIYIVAADVGEEMADDLMSNAEMVEMMATATEENYKDIIAVIKNADTLIPKGGEEQLEKLNEQYRDGKLTLVEYNAQIQKLSNGSKVLADRYKGQLAIEQGILYNMKANGQETKAQEIKVNALKVAIDGLLTSAGLMSEMEITPEDESTRLRSEAIASVQQLDSDVSNLASAYEKLTKKEKLSAAEINKLIELYPELATYIAQTGDLTLDNGRALERLIGKQKDATTSAIDLALAAMAGQMAYKSAIEDTILSLEELKFVEENGFRVGIKSDYSKVTGAKKELVDSYNSLISLRMNLSNSSSIDLLTGNDKGSKKDPKELEPYFDQLRKVAEAEQKLLEIQDKFKKEGKEDTTEALSAEIEQRGVLARAMQDLNKARMVDLKLLKDSVNGLSGDAWVEAKQKIAGLEDAVWDTANALTALNIEIAESVKKLSEDMKKAYEESKKLLEDEMEARADILESAWELEKEKQIKILSETMEASEEEWTRREEALEAQLDLEQEILANQKKELENLKKKDDWNKKLSTSNKKTLDLQYQISLWELDRSEEGQSKVAELQRELAEQIAEHQEMLDDKNYDGKISAIEGLEEASQSKFDKEQDLIESERKEQERLHKEKIEFLNVEHQKKLQNLRQIQEEHANDVEEFKRLTDIEMEAVKGALETFDKELGTAVDNTWDKIAQKIKELASNLSSTGLVDKANTMYDNKSDIISQMKLNSQLYKGTTDSSLQKLLAEASLALGTSLGWIRSSAGKWYTDSSMKTVAPIYHEGGIVGGKAINPKHEEFAKLLKGELVITPKQIDLLSNLVLPSRKTAIADGARQTMYNINIEIDKVIGDAKSGERIADGLVSGLKRKGLLVNFN